MAGLGCGQPGPANGVDTGVRASMRAMDEQWWPPGWPSEPQRLDGTMSDGAKPGVWWWVGVLAAGSENTVTVGAGTAPTVAGAWASASVVVLGAVGVWGRQEYRLTVGGVPVMVIPGLTGDGVVDVDDLREGFAELAGFTMSR
jgi:hypothetical protein